MGWVPTPLDTESVRLPADVVALIERLAEHVHDVWATRRLAEGWRPGELRDDASRTLPGLVPYRELPEAEKEYDRATALATLRALYALGYRVERVDSATDGAAAAG